MQEVVTKLAVEVERKGFKMAKGRISRHSTLPFPSFMFFLLGPDSQVLIVDMCKSLSCLVTGKTIAHIVSMPLQEDTLLLI